MAAKAAFSSPAENTWPTQPTNGDLNDNSRDTTRNCAPRLTYRAPHMSAHVNYKASFPVSTLSEWLLPLTFPERETAVHAKSVFVFALRKLGLFERLFRCPAMTQKSSWCEGRLSVKCRPVANNAIGN
jgi:hypothetical protein